MDARKLIACMAVLVAVFAAFAAVSDEADAATYTARVFIGDGTDSGTTELSGSGGTVKEVLQDALSEHSLVFYGNWTVKSLDGVETIKDEEQWVIYQWDAYQGWTVRVANSTGNAYLEDGTSYYVYYADVYGTSSYSAPIYEPESTAYFFIQFREDVNANEYVTAVLTEEQRSEGFWIAGTGSTAAKAFANACEELGFELEMNDGSGDGGYSADLVGWIGSFLGLGDVYLTDGDYTYWSQFSWDGSSWGYNDYCLGYYDPGVTKYYGLIRQTTSAEDVSGTDLLPGQTPSDVPISKINGGCTVKFVDGNGNVIKTQTVEYFGSATAPTTATKTSSGGYDYTFIGWDKEFDQVISDLTVTALFEASGGGDVSVTGVRLSSVSMTVEVGESFTLTATVSPSDATDKTVTWSSSDRSVATVSGGLVTAVGAGMATITVKTVDGGKTASCTVTVNDDDSPVLATSVKLNSGSLSLDVGGSATLIATVSPSDATDRTVTWSSSDTSVATVSGGVVTAVGAGTATITATAADGSGVCAECTVTVNDDDSPVLATSVKLNSGSLSLDVGGSATLIATVSPSDAADRTVTWSSSDTSVATVSGGVVTAVGAGTATITATAADGSGVCAECTVTVEAVSVDSVRLNSSSLRMEAGGSATLTATVSPSNATVKTVTWSSSDTSVATVSGGVVTAVGAGTATITATASDGSGAYAACTVTVNDDDGPVLVISVELNSGSLSLDVGRSVTLIATVSSSDATVVWSSSDEGVVTVADGVVTAVGAGTATITATAVDGGKTASCAVTVTKQATFVTIGSSFLAMQNGDSAMLVADTDGSDVVSWSSDDESVAVVDSSGKVTMVSDSGTAVITVEIDGLCASCTVMALSSSDVDELISIDLEGTEDDVYTVLLTASHLEILIENGRGFTLNTSIGSVTLAIETLEAICSEGALTVSKAALNEVQAGVVGDSTAYEYLLNGGAVTDLGGVATISMPYTLKSSEDADRIAVYCVDEDGNLEKLECTYADGYVTFETSHFSVYFAASDIGSDAEDDGPSDEGDGGSDAVLYIGIAVAVVVVLVAAVVLMRRS